MGLMSRNMWAISPATPISRNSSFDLAFLGFDEREHRGKRLLVDFADLVGEAVGKLGGAGAEARCVDCDPRMRDAGEAHHILGIVPDDVEISDDALDEVPAWPAALAVFKGREVGGRDSDGARHVLERDAALKPQLPDLLAE